MKNLKILLLSATVFLSVQDFAQSSKQDRYEILRDLDKRVKIEQIPATNIVSLVFSGNYQKHPEAYGKLSVYVKSKYASVGSIIGLYPEDPDLVPEQKLTWKISMRVLPGKPNPASPQINRADPFKIPASKDSLAYPLSKLKAQKNLL